MAACSLARPFYIKHPRVDGETLSARPPAVQDLNKRLEDTRDEVKIQALKELLLWTLNGSQETVDEYTQHLFTSVIRFAVPSHDHTVKKLVQLYWEIVPKTTADGSPKPEVILACNALRNDLTHANEYVRGATLRSLPRINNRRMIEPLLEAIVENLKHNDPYVRRNAVLCICMVIAQLGSDLIPHGIGAVEKVFQSDHDPMAKRAAFIGLSLCDLPRTLQNLKMMENDIFRTSDSFQQSILSLLREVYRVMSRTFPPTPQSAALESMCSKEYVGHLLMEFLSETVAPSVTYSAACAILDGIGGGAPEPTRMATEALASVLTTNSDNNIKLQILWRLMGKDGAVIEPLVIDILRTLSSPDDDLREIALQVALPAVSAKSALGVLSLLKREITKALDPQITSVVGTRKLQCQLIRAIRNVAGRFPEYADVILDVVSTLLVESDSSSSSEMAQFIRQLAVADCASLRSNLLNRLCASLSEVSDLKVLRMSIWILGELCDQTTYLVMLVNKVHEACLPLPFKSQEGEVKEGGTTNARSEQTQMRVVSRTVVLPDGSYGTETSVEPTNTNVEGSALTVANGVDKSSGLRQLLIASQDQLLSSLIAVALTKILSRPYEDALEPHVQCALINKAAFLVACLVKLAESAPQSSARCDTIFRLTQCLTVLSKLREYNGDQKKKVFKHFSNDIKVLTNIIGETQSFCPGEQRAMQRFSTKISPSKASDKCVGNSPDDLIVYEYLGGSSEVTSSLGTSDKRDAMNSLESALLGLGDRTALSSHFERVAKATAISSYGDPIYIEAACQINHYDLIIELLLVNQTADTLQNVLVELSTHGDLKVWERPPAVTLVAGQQKTLFAAIRLQSTETGVIFGYVSYEKNSAMDKEYMVVNELQVDLMDCLVKSWISDVSFRHMWSEFEWENKIAIVVPVGDPFQLLQVLMEMTKMTIVGSYGYNVADPCDSSRATAMKQGKESSSEVSQDLKDLKSSRLFKCMERTSVFSVNLCARSIFGEDALVNLSVENVGGNLLTGNVRIRSRTQGIALSLGDRIAAVQRNLNLKIKPDLN